MAGRFRELLRRQRRPVARVKFALELILAVTGTVALIAALWHHLDPPSKSASPGEGRRIVAFRQLANRICVENRHNQQRALAQHTSEPTRLGFAARALGWNLDDLEGITAPPPTSELFAAEIKVRTEARHQVLELRDAVESKDIATEIKAISALRTLEAKSAEVSREAGIERCMRIVPPI